jgi:hypothetical protein
MKKSIYVALGASALLNAAAPAVLPVEKRTFSQSQFIPDISMIVDMSYASRNKDQDGLAGLMIPGVIEDYYGQEEGDGHGHAHGAYSPDNGFNFNYAELVMSANVDPNFSLDTVFHFTEDGVSIEEAYFTNTTALDGLRIRGGKLLSEFGRLNQQHHHFWDFNDMPLIHQAFVGNEGLNEVGLQLQYTLPFEEYVMIGGEVLQGDNEKSFGNDTLTTSNDEEVKGASAPSLLVGYLKGSFDIGDTSVLPGVSYIYGESRSQHTHADGADAHEITFDGTSSIVNLELTVKHFFDSYSFLAWQTEWMHMEKKGDEYHVETVGAVVGATEQEAQKITQAGYYTQLVYAHDQNWRVGARYDSIYKNDYGFTEEALPSTPYNSYTVMAEYHWSEFSRLRLEYTQNDALYTEGANGFESTDVKTLMLSLNLAIGAHAAHDF